MDNATVTTSLWTHGEVDEAKFAAWVEKTAKSYRRWRDKGKSLYVGWTDEQCTEAARFYCGCYQHHFRVQIQIDPVTRLPI